MIPKIIHACWFGDAPIPEEHQAYIEGWKKIHPDFEIKIWTEKEFAKYYDDSVFVKEAIELKKYAFLSDYFRLVVLYEFGGVYMDTDVEMLKPLESFLDCNLFMGYLFDCSLGTAVIGCSKGNPIMKVLLNNMKDEYEKTKQFTVSNDWMTKYFIENIDGFELSGKRQTLSDGIEIYPRNYFERLDIQKNGGYTIHHCDGSWRKKGFARKYIKPVIKFVLGKKLYEIIMVNRLTKKSIYYGEYKKNKAK